MMKMSISILLVLISIQISISQMATWENENSGRINGVKFKLKNLNKEENEVYEWDYSNTDYFKPFVASKGPYCSYAGSDNWHLSFEKNVQSLALYMGAWRPGVYMFSEPFQLISHSNNVVQKDNCIIVTGKRGFGHGVIKFLHPICCLFVRSSRLDDGPQIMTFGLFESPFCDENSQTLSTSIQIKPKRIKDRWTCRKISKGYPLSKID